MKKTDNNVVFLAGKRVSLRPIEKRIALKMALMTTTSINKTMTRLRFSISST